MNVMFKRREQTPKFFTAIDLGSNSFHMVVAQLENDQLKVVDRLRESVRIADYMDEQGNITNEGIKRGIGCLQRFEQRLREMNAKTVRIVGTNTLRRANNAEDFLTEAENVIGLPIEIISGMEEARLTYSGIAHSLADAGSRRLVVDIGGSSTELIVGENYKPILLRSLQMGCVTFSKQYFGKGELTRKAFNAAELAARVELEPVVPYFKPMKWDEAIGSSGTIRAIRDVANSAGWSSHEITPSTIENMIDVLIEAGNVNKLKLKELSKDRTETIAGGVAVLSAIFRECNVKSMRISESALREGVLYDLIGRSKHQDIRNTTVNALARRYHIDIAHAERVTDTAIYCLNAAEEKWELDDAQAAQFLTWAALLHEVGINIAHSQYHKHSGYIVEYSDMPGFSAHEQMLLSYMVKMQRKKVTLPHLSGFPKGTVTEILRLTILFRLAIVLHRSRTTVPLPSFSLQVEPRQINLSFPSKWLDDHPLTQADLAQERDYLEDLGYQLNFK